MTFNFEAKKYSAQQCNDLFEAILVDDVVNLDASLPDQIHLDYKQEQLVECFEICRQVWFEGFDSNVLNEMLKKLRKSCGFTKDEQLIYKHIRAKFKQLRFAFANFDKKHKYPFFLNAITVLMGTLQDAFKNRHDNLTRRYVILLQLFLMRMPKSLVYRDVNGFKPCGVEDFREKTLSGVDFIRKSLDKNQVTGRQFHNIRKIISRQASFYVALTVLYPSKYHSDVFRYLSTINGMMGRMNDVLVEKELNGVLDYHKDLIEIPEDIKNYLRIVVDKHMHLF